MPSWKKKRYPVGITSNEPITVVKKQVEDFWHGMLHVKRMDWISSSPISALTTGSSDWKKRKCWQNTYRTISWTTVWSWEISTPIRLSMPIGWKHTPNSSKQAEMDAEQETYRNMRDGRLDYSVLSQFLSIGLTDICRLYVPADKRTTFPTAFLYRWQHGDTRLHGISERLDYILVSPSLVSRCVDAHIHNGIETGRISDHYPVSVDLIIHL